MPPRECLSPPCARCFLCSLLLSLSPRTPSTMPALDAAGTFGITLLFGIIPAACVWRLRRDENSEIFVPGGDAVLAAMVGLSAFVIGEGALDALGFL